MITGYQISEALYESERSLIYRAVREEDGANVVLKILNADQIDASDLARFRLEYSITKNLQVPGVAKAFALEPFGNQAMIVFNDIGGNSLSNHLKTRGGKLTVDEFLPVAVALAHTVELVHNKHYIHKDINPTNVVWDPDTGRVELIDFGISTELSREVQGMSNPRVMEGTLPYMSPEQTGRMNRAMDLRTDLYSLGVTFYQMLTGSLPFETDDPMEMVYSHIARVPRSPHDIDNDIPEPLSAIVMKLLSKMAEDRYRSAAGLEADLARCLSESKNSVSIPWFDIGNERGKDQFRIPQKFYGREKEIDTLMDGFARASEGGLEMILVAGYSGIGKSSLVKEIYKPIVRQRGFFISGKFDQYQHDVPYAPFIDAFTQLIKYLLTESDEQMGHWRARLMAALGDEGQIFVDVIPELGLIIGEQAPVIELNGVEAQKRFQKAFLRFLGAFCTADHPLTLFLDDLQWADPASLGLLQTVMSGASGAEHLLLLGAYRDNEVSSSHPLMLALSEIDERKSGNTTVQTVTLGPLSRTDTRSLVADTIEDTEAYAASLAELIYDNTAGNPFFILQLLADLHDSELLTYSHEREQWIWDVDVYSTGISDNVADLLARKIKTLPPDTVEFLGLASCVGNQFDLETLSIISGKSKSEVATGLWQAVLNELIAAHDVACSYHRLSENDAEKLGPGLGKYSFYHDRIQEAAYQQLSDDKRSLIHLEAGRLLLANASDDERNEVLFEIVNHLNFSVELITDKAEQQELALLNLNAGLNAKKSTAYSAARGYFVQGIELLSGDGWTTHPDAMFQLYRGGIECEFLCGNTDAADTMFRHAVEQTEVRRYKGQLYELMIRICENDYAYDKGIELGKQGLALFDIIIPDDPEAYGAACAAIQEEISQHVASEADIQRLADGPAMSDEDIKVCCGILHEMWVCLFMSENPQVVFPAIKLIQLSISYGQSAVTAVGYIFYALIQTMQRDYDAAYVFGRLAMMLKDKHLDPLMAPKVLNTYCNFINHYFNHIETNVPLYEQSFKYCVQSGEIWWGAWAASFIRNARFIKGDPLDKVRAVGDQYADAIREAEFEPLVHVMNAQMAKITNLMGETGTRTSLDTLTYNDEYTEKVMEAMPFGMGLFWHNVSKMFVFYLYGEQELALDAALKAEEFSPHDPGLMQFPDHFFFSTLVYADNWENFTEEEQAKYAELIDRNLDQMHRWQENCPENFRHRYLLMRAEKERIGGDELSAMYHYDQAIDAARDNRFFHHEAVANELAGQFHYDKGREQVARAYFREARFLYLQWGAKRKVEIFDDKQPGLAKPMREFRTTMSSTSATTSRTQALDFQSIMKASQAISGEIVFEKLLKKLMYILMENAGAQKGCLGLMQEGGLNIVAEGQVGNGDSVKLQSRSIKEVDEAELLALSVVNYVTRSKESVVLDDAAKEGEFLQDPYIVKHEPKSVMCAPLVNQGQLDGMVYLENNLTTGAFTQDRLETLTLLSTQAAISIENAALYNTLEQKVSARTLELSDTNNALQAEVGERRRAEEALREVNRKLQEQASLDGLTNIANRRFFDEYMKREWRRMKREKSVISLVFCDIDFFKGYNDSYGHQMGDDCLKKVAQAMNLALRRPADLLARYGGEEFVVLLPNVDEEGALHVAKIIQENVKDISIPHISSTVDAYITVSIGTHTATPDAEADLEAFIYEADKALYDAKESGRNTIVIR